MEWNTLAAVALGGFLSLAGSVAHAIWERRQKRISLGRALSSEIAATLDASEKRQHEKSFQLLLEAWERGENTETVRRIHGIGDGNETQVYRNNLDKLGLLKPKDARDIVRYYGLFMGILSDVQELGNHEIENFEERKNLVRNDLEIFREVKSLGRALQKRLG